MLDTSSLLCNSSGSGRAVRVILDLDGIAFLFKRHVPLDEGGMMYSVISKWSLQMRL